MMFGTSVETSARAMFVKRNNDTNDVKINNIKCSKLNFVRLYIRVL